jgi:hypothetical protein
MHESIDYDQGPRRSISQRGQRCPQRLRRVMNDSGDLREKFESLREPWPFVLYYRSASGQGRRGFLPAWSLDRRAQQEARTRIRLHVPFLQGLSLQVPTNEPARRSLAPSIHARLPLILGFRRFEFFFGPAQYSTSQATI